MTPQQRFDHHRRAVRDRNEELEILALAIYSRLFFTVLSFLVCVFAIPYSWEKFKKSQEGEIPDKDPEKEDPNYIDWSIVFPEEFETKSSKHHGFFFLMLVGAVVTFFLVLVGVKMHIFYN